MSDALNTLQSFTEENLPDLDVVVRGALELFTQADIPTIDMTMHPHPIVLGSGNAEVTGRILFREQDALYADESSYIAKLDNSRGAITDAVVISASGKKHAIEITETLEKRGVKVWLFTNNPQAPAAAHVAPERVLVFPRNREPYTYNTSTYMGMLLGKTKEDPQAIYDFIRDVVDPRIPNNFVSFDAFYFIIPPAFWGVREMLLTKFDELFGPKISGRVFTFEQTKHAKTVVSSQRELFVSFGEENSVFGTQHQRLHIPLPSDAQEVAMMAIGYYVIGHIQKQHPPYFKDRIAAYMREASDIFGMTLAPIVE